MYSKILGSGRYYPEKILSNFDLEKLVDTSDEWIVQRTGIRERHICAENEGVLDMALRASVNALDDAGTEPGELGAIIVTTSTPDYFYPSVACRLQRELKAYGAFSYDISAACTGFIYALDMADRYVRTGGADKVLVVSSERLSGQLDYTDRATCILFGDGAGACIVGKSEVPGGVLGAHLASSPDNWESLYAKIPGDMVMNGSDVFKFAVRAMPEAIDKALAKAGKTMSDVRWLIPHQANLRIIRSVLDRYKLPEEKTVITVAEYANTSSATIPAALDIIRRGGKIKGGDIAVMVGFGAGLTYGAVVVEF